MKKNIFKFVYVALAVVSMIAVSQRSAHASGQGWECINQCVGQCEQYGTACFNRCMNMPRATEAEQHAIAECARGCGEDIPDCTDTCPGQCPMGE
jgi:hypothetical protein